MGNKQSAYAFLQSLQNELNAKLPVADTVRAEVARMWKKPKPEKAPREQLGCKENLFLYHLALPHISKHLESVHGIDQHKAKASLRGEYFAKFPHLMSANTRRIQGHPFAKKIGIQPNDIMQTWKKPPGSQSLNEAYPDLSLTSPFPFKIVFDAKFFDGDNISSAEDALVSGVYEATFYRGLPPTSAARAAKSGWEYDYACLLAYDASEGAHLQEAWDSVESKELFWEDANVFVMILRS